MKIACLGSTDPYPSRYLLCGALGALVPYSYGGLGDVHRVLRSCVILLLVFCLWRIGSRFAPSPSGPIHHCIDHCTILRCTIRN